MLSPDYKNVITDELMRQRLSATRNYCVVILKRTTKYQEEGTEAIIWEHGRRNFALRAAGVLSIVCPIRDDSDVAGIGIFNANVEEVKKIMDGDPAVQAGILSYETHPCRGFPGDSLAGER